MSIVPVLPEPVPTRAGWNQGTGYNGISYWTATSIDRARNSARWTPTLLGPGTYKVQVYIPNEHSTTTNARYTVFASGSGSVVTVNQSLFTNEWIELGTFSFLGNGSEYVELTDFTGENGREIAFDAVRWEG